MGVGAKTMGRYAVRAANGVVNLIILLLILLLIAFGAYALWDSQQIYETADATRYERYRPRIEDEGKSFGELQALNPEVFAWLTVYGTNIDYPVVQGDDNMKYVNTNAEGDYALTGAIFLDSRNRRDFSDFNSIFYGHHMAKEAMFGELDRFADRDFFASHRYGHLYVDGNNYGLEFFLFLHADAYDVDVFSPAVQGEEAQQQYLDRLQGMALQERDLIVTLDDNMFLLSTCSSDSTNGRDILVARLTDTLFENTFLIQESHGEHGTVDERADVLERMPRWLIPAMIVFLLILLTGMVLRLAKRKRH